MTITDKRLAEIDARAAAATGRLYVVAESVYAIGRAGAVASFFEDGARDNAVFLAAARTDVPDLVAALRAERAEREEWQQAAEVEASERRRAHGEIAALRARAEAAEAAIREAKDAAYRRGVEDAARAADTMTRASGQRNAKDQWREGIGKEIATSLRALAEKGMPREEGEP
jgi:hypothetical protein